MRFDASNCWHFITWNSFIIIANNIWEIIDLQIIKFDNKKFNEINENKCSQHATSKNDNRWIYFLKHLKFLLIWTWFVISINFIIWITICKTLNLFSDLLKSFLMSIFELVFFPNHNVNDKFLKFKAIFFIEFSC